MYQLCKLGSARHIRDSRVVGNNTDFWTRMSGYITQAPPLIRVYPWGSYLISLCLSFFTYKVDIIITSHEVISSIKWNNIGKALKIHNKHSTNVSHYYLKETETETLAIIVDLLLWQLNLPLWSVCRPLLKSCVIQYLLLYWSLFEDLLWFSQVGTQSSHNTNSLMLLF